VVAVQLSNLINNHLTEVILCMILHNYAALHLRVCYWLIPFCN